MEQPAVFLSCGSERRYSARLCRERLVWPGLDGCWLVLGSGVRKLHFYARKWSPLQPIWLGVLLPAWGVSRAPIVFGSGFHHHFGPEYAPVYAHHNDSYGQVARPHPPTVEPHPAP